MPLDQARQVAWSSHAAERCSHECIVIEAWLDGERHKQKLGRAHDRVFLEDRLGMIGQILKAALDAASLGPERPGHRARFDTAVEEQGSIQIRYERLAEAFKARWPG